MDDIFHVEIQNLKDQLARVERIYLDSITRVEQQIAKLDTKECADMVRLELQLKESIKAIHDRFDSSIEKLKMDISSLFNEQQRFRETIIDIKNLIEKSSDKTANQISVLSEQMNTIINSKKNFATSFRYPMWIAVAVSVLTVVGQAIIEKLM